jgi:hypothetical protein
MPYEIVIQPSGRLARFSTVTMSNTHVNKSRDEMIAILVSDYHLSEDQARTMVDSAPHALIFPGPYQSGRL